VHGTLDNVVESSNSENLFATSLSDFPPLFVDAGHNDIESKFLHLFLSSLDDFIAFCAKKKSDNAERLLAQNLCFTDASEELRTRSVRSFLDPCWRKKRKKT
jgi:hypothetical protein